MTYPFRLLSTLILVSACIIGVACSATNQQPNVILILTDDQGFGDLRSHGNDIIDTPNMDRIADEGVRFDRFFVSPMCGPTRAALLTGRDNLRTGVSWVSHGKETLRLNEVTIADVFHQAGYATGAFGKWHNGEYGPYHPNSRGFQTFVGFCRGAWQNYFDPVLEHNREPIQTEGYITDVLTDAAIDFMDQNRSRPFFCYIPYNAPHHPFQIPGKYFEKYMQRGCKDETACVYGMVENIDDNIARILDKLDQWQLTENTILVFLSDNGPWKERYNAGMRGRKAEVDEGGVRVPLFIRWPGQIQSGTTIPQIAAHIDLFPTILELCGIPAPDTQPLDGRSLVPLLKSDTAQWPDRMLFTHQNRLGRTEMTPGAVRTQQHRLVNRGNGYELFDMVEDPGQTRDIAGAYPQVTNRLSSAYEKWYSEVTAEGVAPPPIPVGHPAADVTAMQGEDATLYGVKFRGGTGWAHASILNWKSTDDSVTWNLDVLRPGQYEITLMYSCSPADVGSRIQISVGTEKVEATIARAHDPQQPDSYRHPTREVTTSGPVWVKNFVSLTFQPVMLRKGPVNLNVSVLDIPENGTFEVKEVRVRRLD
jgi:arylsulfatase A-like enzyme